MKAIHLILIFIFPSMTFAASEKVRAAKEVIELYQDEAVHKNGNYISVIFDPQPRFHATARIFQDRSEIRLYAKMVEDMTPHELVAITCHEIGHILGEIKHANIIGGGMRNFREAVEGEADYFGGKCLRKYIETTTSDKDPAKVASQIATTAYQKLLQMRIPLNASLAEKQKIIGILPAYPSPDCRLLTVFRGIEDKDRPKCWYNPE